MSMKCSHCGGLVEWKGPLSNLTHTECLQCGAVNAQLPDERQDDDESDELREMVDVHAAAFVQRMHDGIRALLGQHATAVSEFAVHMHNRVRRAEAVADALANSSCTFDADADRITFANASTVLAALNIYRLNKRG